jgi:hypothetical protein
MSQMDEASLITWDIHMRGVAAGGDGASSAITGTATYYVTEVSPGRISYVKLVAPGIVEV